MTARTATPRRSISIDTSWAWMPPSSNEKIAPLPGALPMILSELIAESRSWA